MSLQDIIDETKAKIEEINVAEEKKEDSPEPEREAEKDPEKEPEEENNEAEDQEADEKQDDAEAEGDPEEKEAKEEAKKDEEPLDDKGFARLRREKAALEKKLKDAEAKIANPDGEEKEADASTGMNEEFLDIIQERRIEKATREFAVLEEDFKKNVSDFDDISNGYKAALYQSLRLQNPRRSHVELLEDTKNVLLNKAGMYIKQGLDPIQEMYEEAKSLGFKAISKEEAKDDEGNEDPEIKPDLDKIAKNKKKNAGMVGGKGAGAGGQLTRESAADMTSGEWMRLPAAEKKRILSGG